MNQQSEEIIIPPSHLYYLANLSIPDSALIKMQCSHIMLLFFFIDGLEILNKIDLLDQKLPHQNITFREHLLKYILSLQMNDGSFSCSTLYSSLSNQYGNGHIVFIYSALNCIQIFDALDQLEDKQKIIQCVSRYQKQDGSFSSFQNSDECDLRFVYSAISICKLLGDFSKINLLKTKEYIDRCFNYDGGFGLRPNCQSHCGAIFCAIASYHIIESQIDEIKKMRTLNFLVNRQSTQVNNQNIVGIQGRVGKLPDSCYSFWAGASIYLLTGKNLLNKNLKNFISLCYIEQQKSFSKYPSSSKGDPIHTFHSITALKILQNDLNSLSLARLIKIEH